MKYTSLCCAVLAASIGITTLVGCSNEKEQSTTAALPVRTAFVDLASGVHSVDELVTTADVLVTARSIGATQTTDPRDPELPTTHQRFRVTRSVVGTTRPGDEITVAYTGGVVGPAGGRGRYVLEVENEPAFTQDQEYVLALLGPKPDGEYFVIGGPQGRYEVVAGKLRAVTGMQVNTVEGSLHGRPVDAVVRQLSSIAARETP